MTRRLAMTTTKLRILGLGRSPRCDRCAPDAQHPYLRGEPLLGTLPDVVRFTDGNAEHQLCLDCLAADSSEAALDFLRGKIRENMMMRLSVCPVDLTVEL
jgi:hypothetical protein